MVPAPGLIVQILLRTLLYLFSRARPLLSSIQRKRTGADPQIAYGPVPGFNCPNPFEDIAVFISKSCPLFSCIQRERENWSRDFSQIDSMVPFPGSIDQRILRTLQFLNSTPVPQYHVSNQACLSISIILSCKFQDIWNQQLNRNGD